MDTRQSELEGFGAVAAHPSVASAISAVRDLLGFEIAYATEINDTHQVFKLLRGDGESFGVHQGLEMPIEMTYCRHILAGALPNVIPDVPAHAVAGALPMTESARVGAFASVPLTFSDGRVFGTLCAASHAPMPELGARDEQFLHVFARIVADQLELEQAEAERQSLALTASASQALITAVGARDAYTARHSIAVVDNALRVARRLGLDEETIENTGRVALLHDIGKLAIPSHILHKPAGLDEDEWKIMRTHPAIGSEMVGEVPDLAHLTAAVRAEHERWDGTGYPDGLHREEIPIESRITLACDAYDAMTTDRPYRQAMSEADARAQLECNAGTQFCPTVVPVLLTILAERNSANGDRPGVR